MTWGRPFLAGAAAAAMLAAAPTARAQSARIGGLEDVTFGPILTAVDRSNSQNVVLCSYRNNPQRRDYSVTATGSGSGGAFELSSGAGTLAYDVQWADSPGQTGGTMLQAGVPATGFGNAATGFTCPEQPDTASLTVTISAADIASAQAGNYSGLLQITIVPE
jgi:hypothetical protein